MLIKSIQVGYIETNCYIVSDENTLECAVIDPGDESNTILDYLEDNKLKCMAILLTHGHFDHVGAVEAVQDETGAAVYMHESDDFSRCGDQRRPYSLGANGKYVVDGDIITVSSLEFKVLETPGHTPGGLTYICGDAIFSGDTLFRGSCGRVDLPGGDMDLELDSLKKICSLRGDYEVYPGHMDSSTLAREKEFNYYCTAAQRR